METPKPVFVLMMRNGTSESTLRQVEAFALSRKTHNILCLWEINNPKIWVQRKRLK